MTVDNHRAIIDETTLQLAESGVRGATLRKIGARSGINFARLTTAFGDKDRLIAACFADVVERDLGRLASLAEELAGASPIHLFWALCEDAGGLRRTDNLVLIELLLSSGRAELAEIFRRWIRRRRDLLRAVARHCGADPLLADILGLIVLMESGFAVSNYDSLSYRIVARASLDEAFERMAGSTAAGADPALEALAADYYARSSDRTAPDGGHHGDGARQGKSQIVNAAAEMFVEQGPEHLTNRAVAERAGVSLALTTYHFGSITELTLAALRRAVENLARSLEPDETREELRDAMLEDRRRPAHAPHSDVHFHLGTLHVSLTAARVPSEAHLGHLIRRQIGLLAYAAVDKDKRGREVSRTAAASYALWAGACYLVARHFPQDDQAYDFEAQASIAGRCLLGFDHL